MKYTIEGFDQKTAISYGLDVVDLTILRWFVDFMHSKKIAKVQYEGREYCWINYKGLLEDMPILNIKKRMLAIRLKKLTDAGVLVHVTKKSGGTFSLYAIGDNYINLIDSEGSQKIAEGSQNITEGVVNKFTTPTSINLPPKDYSTKKDYSTNKIINIMSGDDSDKQDSEIYVRIIDYLNTVTGTKFKPTVSRTRELIKARLNEGFSEEDFKTVIKKKYDEWHGTEWAKYLRPSTLFGTKFESYLNQVTNNNSEQEKGKFDDYELPSDFYGGQDNGV